MGLITDCYRDTGTHYRDLIDTVDHPVWITAARRWLAENKPKCVSIPWFCQEWRLSITTAQELLNEPYEKEARDA